MKAIDFGTDEIMLALNVFDGEMDIKNHNHQIPTNKVVSIPCLTSKETGTKTICIQLSDEEKEMVAKTGEFIVTFMPVYSSDEIVLTPLIKFYS